MFSSRRLVTLLLLLVSASSAQAATRSFWVWDLTVMPPAFRQPAFDEAASATIGDAKLHVWVEQNLGEHAPSASVLTELVPVYTKAITLEQAIFGLQPVPPSGDRDIHLLIAAIPPYEKNGKKFGFDGFFNVFDQLRETDAQSEGQHSNEHNIIYVNALQDVNSDYMRAVVVHELNHLLTNARYDAEKNPLDGWVNEMLGEAAMELDGYYTDAAHVNRYRALPEQPLAVTQFGISYGGLSLLAEYLLTLDGPEALGRVAPAQGDGFARLASVYKRSWNELFAGYARWLFEAKSAFAGDPVEVKNPEDALRLAPTGVLYLPASFDVKKLSLGGAPQGCTGSVNVLKSRFVSRADSQAQAVWVESTPPCAVTQGGKDFNGFEIRHSEGSI